MKELLANILTVSYIANDIHYRTVGSEFYGLHLLADRIKDFGSATDDLKECYYMGFCMDFPPYDTEIAELAIAEYRSINEKAQNPLSAMSEALTRTICLVESAKRLEGITGGIHAILDSISQHATTMRGLVKNSIGAKEEDK